MMTKLSKNQILQLFGPVSDHTVVEILSTDATIGDLEFVALNLTQQDDLIGKSGAPLDGEAARVLDILRQDELFVDDQMDHPQTQAE